MRRFDGKTIVITGVSTGIGRATAIALARQGARLVLGGISEEPSRQLVAQLKDEGAEALFQRTDVRHEEQVAGLINLAVSMHGAVHGLFNNAGIVGQMHSITQQTEQNVADVMGVNVLGVIWGMKHALAQMKRQGFGAVVNNASITGVIAMGNAPIYAASKHAVIGLTRSAALEFARTGIRVNAVAPGGVETPMIEQVTGHSRLMKQAFANMHPMQRFATPDEIASAVTWLLSDESSFVTGHTLLVDGGYTAQ